MGKYATTFRALALGLVVLFALEFFFGGGLHAVRTAFESAQTKAQLAQAAGGGGSTDTCGTPPGAVFVNHQICNPPGPPSNGGHDTYYCHARLPDGLILDGSCMAGCCRMTNYTPYGSVFGGGGGTLGERIVEGIVVQTAVGALQSLFSGMTGGSYGGGGYYGGGSPQYIDDIDTYLDYETGKEDNTNKPDLGFDDEPNDNTNNNGSLTYGSGDSGTSWYQNIVNAVTGKNTKNTDSVSTTYEQTSGTGSTGSGSVGVGAGSSNGSSVGAGVDGTLSLADLERAAEEARRREALLNEQNGTGVGDYRDSNVSLSGGRNNDLASDYYASLEEGTTLSWWQRLLLFLSGLVGVSPSGF